MPIANQTRKRKLGTLAKTEFFLEGVGNVTRSSAHVKFVACFDYDFCIGFQYGFFKFEWETALTRVLSLSFFTQLSLPLTFLRKEMTRTKRTFKSGEIGVEFGTREHSDHSRKEKLNF